MLNLPAKYIKIYYITFAYLDDSFPNYLLGGKKSQKTVNETNEVYIADET
jgi:hypothetical protein